MGLYRYRVFSGSSKPDSIEDCKAAVEHSIPHGESRIVKRYQGRKKLATYRVERDIRGGILWVQLANN